MSAKSTSTRRSARKSIFIFAINLREVIFFIFWQLCSSNADYYFFRCLMHRLNPFLLFVMYRLNYPFYIALWYTTIVELIIYFFSSLRLYMLPPIFSVLTPFERSSKNNAKMMMPYLELLVPNGWSCSVFLITWHNIVFEKTCIAKRNLRRNVNTWGIFKFDHVFQNHKYY